MRRRARVGVSFWAPGMRKAIALRRFRSTSATRNLGARDSSRRWPGASRQPGQPHADRLVEGSVAVSWAASRTGRGRPHLLLDAQHHRRARIALVVCGSGAGYSDRHRHRHGRHLSCRIRHAASPSPSKAGIAAENWQPAETGVESAHSKHSWPGHRAAAGVGPG